MRGSVCRYLRLNRKKSSRVIAADALVDVVEFFSWNGFGERALQQGESAYLALKEGREHFAEAFNLTQDFSLGVEPAFNGEGEAAPEKLTVIEKGSSFIPS